jgi:Anaerobic ribonucleoside-triphosphate reductase
MTSDLLDLNDTERTRCEVWTRVMGYHRPVSAFNAGKRSEHAERRPFVEQSPKGHAAGHGLGRCGPAQCTAAA